MSEAECEMIKAFGHIVKRAGIEILVRPNATGMAAYHGRLQSGVGDQTVKRHSIHGESHRQSKESVKKLGA